MKSALNTHPLYPSFAFLLSFHTLRTHGQIPRLRETSYDMGSQLSSLIETSKNDHTASSKSISPQNIPRAHCRISRRRKQTQRQAVSGKRLHSAVSSSSTNTRCRYLIVGFMLRLNTTKLKDVRGHLQPGSANGIFSIRLISFFVIVPLKRKSSSDTKFFAIITRTQQLSSLKNVTNFSSAKQRNQPLSTVGPPPIWLISALQSGLWRELDLPMKCLILDECQNVNKRQGKRHQAIKNFYVLTP